MNPTILGQKIEEISDDEVMRGKNGEGEESVSRQKHQPRVLAMQSMQNDRLSLSHSLSFSLP